MSIKRYKKETRSAQRLKAYSGGSLRDLDFTSGEDYYVSLSRLKLKVENQLTNHEASPLKLHVQTIGCFIRPAAGVPAPQMYGRDNYPSHYSLRRGYYH